MLVKSACYSFKILDYTDYISWGIGYGPISIGGSHNTYNNKNLVVSKCEVLATYIAPSKKAYGNRRRRHA